jgi:DNA (cytosine-5)-methyltransferase 1
MQEELTKNTELKTKRSSGQLAPLVMPRKLLDLFCCAGGAAMGMHKVFPNSEIVGVDIKSQPRYPFTFIQADAMTFPLEGYDFIWASPPCQAYSEATPITTKGKHPRLIEETRERLVLAGVPYIIENVEGARGNLKNPMMLCGTMFGLGVWRHRYFETNPNLFMSPMNCQHVGHPVTVNPPANARKNQGKRDFDKEKKAMGIDWMDKNEISQAVPPAYSEYLLRTMFATA